MKKIIAMLLVFSMTLSMMACGTKEEAPAETEETVAEEEAPAEEAVEEEEVSDGKVKIGFICWGYTDAESMTYVRLLDYAGEACGFEPVYATYADNEDIINQAEALIQAGCQGILSIIVTPALIDICEEAGVYCAQYGSAFTDADVEAYLNESPYWAGYSWSNDIAMGEQLIEQIYEAGSRNVLLVGLSAGNTCHDQRREGILNAIEKYEDMNLVGEFLDADLPNKAADAVTSFLNMYPEIDGIVLTGGSGGNAEPVLQAIVNQNKAGDIKFAFVDVIDNTRDYLEEGSVTSVTGFTCTEVVWLSLIMTNLVNGWEAEIPVALAVKSCVIDNVDLFDDFSTYVQGEGIQPFTAEEYQSVTYTLNPDVTVADFEALASATSPEELAAKANK